MSSLFETLDQYKELLDRKDELKDLTKENNIEIERVKKELYQTMVDNECPSISRNGYRYSLREKICFNKKSEEDLRAAGVEFFDVLRSEGLGDLIVETVNHRTLQSALSSVVEENGALPEGLEACINEYETFDVVKRKETAKISK